MAATKADRIVKDFQPITEAEANLVVQRLEDDTEGRSVDEIVAEVKSERIGPAANWEAAYAAEQDAAAAAAEAEASHQAVAPSKPGEHDRPGDEGGLEGWVRVVVEADDDEVAAWVADHTVDEILETVDSTPDDLRPGAAARVRAVEHGRGEDVRSTLVTALDKHTEVQS